VTPGDVTMWELKYKPGTKLRVLTDRYTDDNDKRYPYMRVNKIITVTLCVQHSLGYDFKEGRKGTGWVKSFIEDSENFAVVPSKITNWKQELEE